MATTTMAIIVKALVCAPQAGAAMISGSMVCDDANTDEGDYCASDCQLSTGKMGTASFKTSRPATMEIPRLVIIARRPAPRPPVAVAMARFRAIEACDDGNVADGDYCSATCQSVSGACGDGNTQANELCDDGNTVPGDYCSSDCLG